MSNHFASGTWHVKEGSEEEFVQRWREFLEWTRAEHPAMLNASLIRNQTVPNHFVSFAEWADADSRNAWKQTEGFMQRQMACRELCEKMTGSDFDRVVSI
ncbi:putative quinol monooxygenase [Aeromicrobium sp.]|uniref:putative quinol monooxygenase n=1 Tax=Aeromicrobium sp. TaxID=1871063 RepID=UPI003D6A746B